MAVIGAACVSACTPAGPPDRVDQATKANDVRLSSDHDPEWRQAAEFLVQMTDSRLMGIQQGKMAASRGVSGEVRSYGGTMMSEQATLLREIQALASQLGVSLPSGISNDNAEELRRLSETSRKDIDAALIRRMRADLQRDVAAFERATKFQNARVSGYASNRLPTLQSHLDEIVRIDAIR